MTQLLQYHPPRTIEISDPVIASAGVRLFIRMEYENHPTVKGNKWWKLKHNLAQAKNFQRKTLLTFGGAYSNHIYATAAAAKETGFNSVGIIRGEKVKNEILDFAESQHMDLQFINREQYRQKEDPSFLEELSRRYQDPYILPEGGTNDLAVTGCSEWARTLIGEHEFDVLCLPVGTGGTMAGLVCGLAGTKQVVGVSVLKNGSFLRETVATLIQKSCDRSYGNWNVLTSYDHGGYARTTDGLGKFMEEMRCRHSLHLEHVYTGKMMYGIWTEITRGNFIRGSTILALHTGGVLSPG